MSNPFVTFDSVRERVCEIVKSSWATLRGVAPVYLVRDLLGKVRISVSESVEADTASRNSVRLLADSLQVSLGPHSYAAEVAVLFTDSAMLEHLSAEASEICDGIYWVDRLVTGHDWWTVKSSISERMATRYTLYSVKGGVGRSTTSAILAWHLAQNGAEVIVLDLDLESPGLSSTMLDDNARPEFGITDWFVEDLVGQGDFVLEAMTATPSWAQDFDGSVRIVPAHGREPGEYLAKLGRVYMDTDHPWTARLNRLLSQLESTYRPTILLLESRSGLHDIAAATVAHIDAHVLIFAVDSESNWTDLDILFRHWQSQESRGLASKIRERLSIVSGLTPELDTEQYLRGFRERSWDLFRHRLYDSVAPTDEPGDEYSFDLHEEGAPHDPIPIHWTRGLAAGVSLRHLEVQAVSSAYWQFLKRFDDLLRIDNE